MERVVTVLINDEARAGKPDMSAIAAAAARLKTHAAQVPTWFPKGSGAESGAKTAAKAEIWSDAAGFASAWGVSHKGKGYLGRNRLVSLHRQEIYVQDISPEGVPLDFPREGQLLAAFPWHGNVYWRGTAGLG